MIITVYIDESGTHGEPSMVLGGRAAALGQWVDFNRKWARLLKREGLEYFHGTEFRSRRGLFKGWSVDRRDSFLTEADKIVAKHTRFGFAVTMKLDDYKNVYRQLDKPKRMKIDSKYGLCFRMCLIKLPRLIARSLPEGNHTINFVLESGDSNSGDARVIFDDAKANGWPDLPGLLGTLEYGDKKVFAGLQAADLVAFSALQAERQGGGDLTPSSDNHTLRDMGRMVPYKSPVIKYEVHEAAMRELIGHGRAELERRKRFWLAGRSEAKGERRDKA